MTAPEPQRPPRRSTLRLDAGAPGADELARAQALVREGSVRARNMAHALAMIVYLLTRAVAERAGRRIGRVVLAGALALALAVVRLTAPAIERLRAEIARQRPRLVRALLLGAIRVLEPLELAAERGLKAGRAAIGRLAARSQISLVEGLTLCVGVLVSLIKRGTAKPWVRAVLTRLVRVLERLEGKA